MAKRFYFIDDSVTAGQTQLQLLKMNQELLVLVQQLR